MNFSKMLDQEVGKFSLLEIMVVALVVMVLYLVYKQMKGNFGAMMGMGNMPSLTARNLNIKLSQEQKDKMKKCMDGKTWDNSCLPAFPKPK